MAAKQGEHAELVSGAFFSVKFNRVDERNNDIIYNVSNCSSSLFDEEEGDLKKQGLSVRGIVHREYRPSWTLIATVVILGSGLICCIAEILGSLGKDDAAFTMRRLTSSGSDSSIKDTDSTLFQQELEEVVGSDFSDFIASSPVAFQSAVNWLYQDVIRSKPEAGVRFLQTSTMQRFVLGWLWFHTTNSGDDPWISCNPADEDIAETSDCTFLTPSVVEVIEGDIVICYEGIPAVRWLSAAHECTWPGITCDENGDVIEIVLNGVGLRGTFPSFLGRLPKIQDIQLSYGAMSSSFPQDVDQKFEDLQQLVLIGNTLGGPIPNSFFNMPLVVLNLAYNKFKGPLPTSIGSMAQIGSLYLMNNEFEGPLPEELSQAQTLQYLRLENNAFTGSTLPASWGDLENLRLLFMFQNGLQGTIPQEWTNMTSMENFRLYDNMLEGPLPEMNWPYLERLFLGSNSFEGNFPEELFSMKALQFVDLSENNFKGPLADRFNETGLDNLVALALEDNRFTGKIPPSLEQLDAIRIIRLHFNNFEGQVPDGICDIRGPSTLAFLEADCSGDPVANECECCTTCCDREARTCEIVSARRLWQTVDSLESEIPSSLLPRERALQTSSCAARYLWNSETGLLEPYSDGPPTLTPTEPPAMSGLDVFRNKLIELVGPSLVFSSPEAFESAVLWFYTDELKYETDSYMDTLQEIMDRSLNLQRFALAWLWFHTTANGEDPWLSCNAPDESKGEDESCTLLTVSVVELIDDEIVMCYTSVPSTRWLSATNECDWPGVNCEDTKTIAYEVDLLAVGLKGTFPTFLQIMPGIESIQLTYGALSGPLPHGMENFQNLRQLVLIGNQLEGPIPNGFFEMPLWILNLAYNKFKGPIPKGIGNLTEIGGLYLMDNEFEGPLPDSLGNLETLVFLRMENNALAGSTLPASWGNLADLQLLFMYNNGLVGTIAEEWSNLTSMTNFRLYDNDLEGPLPNMEAWGSIERIFMQGNSFNGTFPEEFFSMTGLQYLQIAENELSGPLPDRFDVAALDNLIAMALNDNKITGTIPPSLEDLDAIRIIRLYNNEFEGQVPDNICNIRGPSSLALLEADCGGDPIANECSCCTSCCDRENQICEVVEERRLSVLGDIQEEEVMGHHQHHHNQHHHDKLPQKRRRMQTNDCITQYRWDRDTGRLIEYVAE